MAYRLLIIWAEEAAAEIAAYEKMTAMKLTRTEELETSGVFEFSDGPVVIEEREVHEFYRIAPVYEPRLIVGEAVARTKDFVAKARAEFSELNSLMRELQTR